MNNSITVKQNSKWQLVAISNDVYDSGNIFTNVATLTGFKDLSKQYLVVIYKRNYNGMVLVQRTDDYAKAMSIYNKRYNTLSTSHAVVITYSSDNDTIKEVQGRNSYRILVSDGQVLLVKPKNIYL